MILHGELAQLVERLHGMQKVSSSKLLFSTIFYLISLCCFYPFAAVFAFPKTDL